MSEQLRALLFPSRFFAWAQNTQTTISLDAARTLIQEGQEGTELLLLIEGRGLVSSLKDDGESVVLAEVGAGQILGEMSFLEGRPSVASVIGQPGSQWIRIPLEILQLAVDNDKELAADFYNVLARKLALQLQSQNALVHRWKSSEIEPLRKVLLVFAELNDLDIDWLSRKGTVQNFKHGKALIEQGSKLNQLWIILKGEADIFLIDDLQRQQVGSSRRGELLGEIALLSSNSLATANVVASSDMQLLAIPHSAIKDRMNEDVAFSSRFHRALSVLLSHRDRDQLMSHGLASKAHANETLSLDILDNVNQAGRRFEWLCRQAAAQ